MHLQGKGDGPGKEGLDGSWVLLEWAFAQEGTVDKVRARGLAVAGVDGASDSWAEESGASVSAARLAAAHDAATRRSARGARHSRAEQGPAHW